MSTSPHSLPQLPRGPDVLGELLHSLSQPLTGLRLFAGTFAATPARLLDRASRGAAAGERFGSSATDRKSYWHDPVDARVFGRRAACAGSFSSALAPAMRSVIEELSSIAAVRGVRLRLVGTCTATLPVPESRLRLALQYLISTLIEAQPVGGKVMLLLGEGPAGAVLRAGWRARAGFEDPADETRSGSGPADQRCARSGSRLAGRVFETAGASLVLGGATLIPTGFVLRIPRRLAAPAR